MGAALLPALTLAACGNAARSPLSVAAGATAGQVSVKTTVTERLTSPSLRQVITTEAVFDRVKRSGLHHQTTTTNFPGFRRVTSDGILVEDVVWLRSSLLELAVGPRWVRVDLQRPGTSASLVDAASNALRRAMPDETLELIRDATNAADTVGVEAIDGVATTHYRAALDQRKVAEILESPVDTITYRPLDVWVDEQDLVRQVRIAYGPSSTARTQVVITTRFSDYGTPVSVTPPPAREVVDASEVREG
jgi:hypothetical protein